MIQRIKNTPLKKCDRLNFSRIRIILLYDYIKVINDNGKQLTSPPGKHIIATGQTPAHQLYEYLILEICSFYDYVKELKKKNLNTTFPDLPDYLGQIYRFRDSIPAHMDKDERLQTREDFVKSYEFLFQKIGIKRIISDFENYYKKCVDIFESKLI